VNQRIHKQKKNKTQKQMNVFNGTEHRIQNRRQANASLRDVKETKEKSKEDKQIRLS
jgi:hypothetical protein